MFWAKWAPRTGLDEPKRHFMAAQGYQSLGDMADARREYEAAVRIAPENLVYRLGLAKLLLSTDVAAATAQFEQILKQDPSQADARRHLATLLAMSGDDAGYQRAVALLQQDGNNPQESGNASHKPDNRLRAILLARRGKTRARAAREFQHRQPNFGAATGADRQRRPTTSIICCLPASTSARPC